MTLKMTLPHPTHTPSLTVSITFEGQKIPKHITMFHVRYSVSPYISRVSRCNQCFRFGHIKINKNQPRCVHYDEKGHSFSKENCQRSDTSPKCVNCQGDHRVDSSTCPEFTTKKKIRKFAAYRNISLLDAREIFRGNRSPPPYSSSSEEFPSLPLFHYTHNPLHDFILSRNLSSSAASSIFSSYAYTAKKLFKNKINSNPSSTLNLNFYSNLSHKTKSKSFSLLHLKHFLSSQSLDSPLQNFHRPNVSFSEPPPSPFCPPFHSFYSSPSP